MSNDQYPLRQDALSPRPPFHRGILRRKCILSGLSLRHWVVFFVALSALSGCATYQFGARSLYPADVNTVYLPIFESESFRRGIGERLTEAVAKEIELKTPFKVVGDPNADSVLAGTIVGDSKRVTIRTNTDFNRAVETRLQVQVRWANRRGDLMRAEQLIEVPLELQSIRSDGRLFPEVGQSLSTGQQQAIDSMAQQIVAMMEAPW
jgi:hypothetical protein